MQSPDGRLQLQELNGGISTPRMGDCRPGCARGDVGDVGDTLDVGDAGDAGESGIYARLR